MRLFFKRFNSVELITFIYGIVTAVYILLFYSGIENSSALLLNRLYIFAALFAIMFVTEKFENIATRFIRYVVPFALIAYWYPETYFLNHALDKTGPLASLAGDLVVPNLDKFFDELDIWLFGCSPAMVFSEALPRPIVSEIMYFGYFAYYLIFAVVFGFYFFARPQLAEQAMFYSLCSFFIFYILFIFIPVSGPQFYYPYPDNQVPDGYLFTSIMRGLQTVGEKPTGAFPSSHVGLTMISMYLLFKEEKKLFYIILPVAIILIASTVYIKAHYLIDVIASFVLTPVILLISKKIFRLFKITDT